MKRQRSRKGDGEDPYKSVTEIDLADAQELVRFAQGNEFIVRAFRLVDESIFSQADFRILLTGGSGTPLNLEYMHKPAFLGAISAFLSEANFYLHSFPVVIFRVHRHLSKWLFEQSLETDLATAFPVQIQPFDTEHGSLYYINHQLTGRRAYYYEPHEQEMSDTWEYVAYAHLNTGLTIEPLSTPAGGGGASVREEEGTAGEFPLRGGRVDGKGMAYLPSPLRRLRQEANNLLEIKTNILCAESRTAHPPVYWLKRPFKDLMPEYPSREAIINHDTMTAASMADGLEAMKQTLGFMVGYVEQIMRDPPPRPPPGGLPAPEVAPLVKEMRRRFDRPDPADDVVDLPELIGAVQQIPATYQADLSLWETRFVEQVARMFDGLPPLDLLGRSQFSESSTTTAGGAMEAEASIAKLSRQRMIERERRTVDTFFQFMYRHAFARVDLEGLAMIIATYPDVEQRWRLGRLLADQPGPAANPKKKDRRQIMEEVVTGGDGGAPAAATIPTATELMAMVDARLVAKAYFTASLEFDEAVSMEERDLEPHERLPGDVRDRRVTDLTLLLEAAKNGVISREDFHKAAKKSIGADTRTPAEAELKQLGIGMTPKAGVGGKKKAKKKARTK